MKRSNILAPIAFDQEQHQVDVSPFGAMPSLGR